MHQPNPFPVYPPGLNTRGVQQKSVSIRLSSLTLPFLLLLTESGSAHFAWRDWNWIAGLPFDEVRHAPTGAAVAKVIAVTKRFVSHLITCKLFEPNSSLQKAHSLSLHSLCLVELKRQVAVNAAIRQRAAGKDGII
jgi:hypothetical protein